MEIQRISKPKESNGHSQNPKFSPILQALGEEFGYMAAHAILMHVSHFTMKSMEEILTSDYDKFSRILKKVYTDGVAEREILSRLSSYGLKEKIG